MSHLNKHFGVKSDDIKLEYENIKRAGCSELGPIRSCLDVSSWSSCDRGQLSAGLMVQRKHVMAGRCPLTAAHMTWAA